MNMKIEYRIVKVSKDNKFIEVQITKQSHKGQKFGCVVPFLYKAL